MNTVFKLDLCKMAYRLLLNGKEAECEITEEQFSYEIRQNNVVTTVKEQIVDIIGVERINDPKTTTKDTAAVKIHIIDKAKSPKWTKKIVTFNGQQDVCESFVATLNSQLDKIEQRPKNVLVIVNPIGGKKNGRMIYETVVQPLFQLANIKAEIIYTEKAKHVTEIVSSYDISKIDGLILGGGDGTLQECIHTLLKRTQEEAGINYNDPDVQLKPIDIPIGLLPLGTGNGAAQGCYDCVDYVTATLHIIRGQRKTKHLGGVYTEYGLLNYFALLVAYGVFGDLMYSIDKNRGLGTFRYAFTGLYELLVKRQQEMQFKVAFHEYAVKSQNDQPESEQHSSGEEILPVNENLVNVKGLYTCALMFVGDPTDDDLNFGLRYSNPNRCLFTLIKPCSRFQFITLLLNMFTRSRNAFKKDFLENYKVTRWKITAKPVVSNTQPMTNKLNLDGEIFTLDKPEFEVRNLLLSLMVTVIINPENSLENSKTRASIKDVARSYHYVY